MEMNTQTPFFSIIIPTFNRSTLLPESIQTVIDQRFTNWECIVVDDGSTDNTANVVNEFVQKDSRLIYIYQDNAERSAARNNGIKRAKGKYICFLDSDDLYLPDHLADMHDRIIKKGLPVALVIGGVVREKDGIRTIVPFESPESFKNNICFFLFSSESVIPARVAIHIEILKTHSFDPNLRVGEDVALWVKIASFYPVFAFPEANVVYKIHEDNTTNIKKNPYQEQLKTLRVIFSDKKIRSLVPKRLRTKKISKCYQGISFYFELNHLYLNAFPYLLKSVIIYPYGKELKARVLHLLKIIYKCLKLH